MSNGLSTASLLQSYAEDTQQTLDEHKSRGRPPSGLKAIGVISAIVGLLGIGRASFSALGLAYSEEVVKRTTSGGLHMKLQQRLAEKAAELAEQLFAVHVFSVVIHFAIAGALVAGGIMVLTRSRQGRSFLAATCLWAIVFEAGRVILYSYTNLQTMSVVRDVMEQGSIFRNAEFRHHFLLGAQTSIFVGFFFVFAIAAVKGCYYAYVMSFLRRPNVQEYFGEGHALELRAVETPSQFSI